MGKERIKEMAQWLREAIPKEYKMAPWTMVLDTRPAKNPREFMVILLDDEHKLLYTIPVSMIREVLSHVGILERKGAKEFEALAVLSVYGEIKRMNKTKIEYLDFTWNPGVGCSGTGCAVRKKCWAMRSAKRQPCPLCKAFVPHFHPERLNQPLERRTPAIIGCCFSGEFFELEPEARAKILNVIHSAYWHEFLILTKQPHKIPHEDYPDNLWIGVTINKVEDLWRLGLLKNRPGVKHRFISFEPL